MYITYNHGHQSIPSTILVSHDIPHGPTILSSSVHQRAYDPPSFASHPDATYACETPLPSLPSPLGPTKDGTLYPRTSGGSPME